MGDLNRRNTLRGGRQSHSIVSFAVVVHVWFVGPPATRQRGVFVVNLKKVLAFKVYINVDNANRVHSYFFLTDIVLHCLQVLF